MPARRYAGRKDVDDVPADSSIATVVGQCGSRSTKGPNTPAAAAPFRTCCRVIFGSAMTSSLPSTNDASGSSPPARGERTVRHNRRTVKAALGKCFRFPQQRSRAGSWRTGASPRSGSACARSVCSLCSPTRPALSAIDRRAPQDRPHDNGGDDRRARASGARPARARSARRNGWDPICAGFVMPDRSVNVYTLL